MRRVDIIRHPSPVESAEIRAFVDAQTTADGRPISDHLWLDLQGGGSPGFVAVTAAESVGLTPRTIALALVSRVNDGAALEVVLDASDTWELDDDDRQRVFADVVDTAIDAFRHDGGGDLTWWLDDPSPATLELAASFKLASTRTLHEMRRDLPHPQRATITTRGFDPRHDAEAWLAVNNRAFATHPEQGGWTVDTLRLRLEEPWFDADGFRLHEIEGELAGFCWTKLHANGLGEIYVIAIDPAFHGRGLGRELTLAGLDWLSDHGVVRATLYVDGGNTAAVGLYERLGFEIHRTRHAFAGKLNK